MTAPPQKRCALYTRKSSEEGLDQSFNSLDAQREACSAYVLSQAHEGWTALPARYDDGGFSGGSMERPGLRALLADIEAGRIDTVVVYKIDRLTRSLADFARMVELFDKQDVSFVSVTQQFNTTSSMGRLTLNVLLSFAQFEREVTGERIRDKIAASKKKGMWMGGSLPLGYDLPQDDARALAVNEIEAATVRMIFERYLELGSVNALKVSLDEDGILSKRTVTRKGKVIGGKPFSRGALFYLLRNRTYLGKIVHKDEVYDGAHHAIVDQRLFTKVQRQLDRQRRRHGGAGSRRAAALLTGRIFDAESNPMSPTFSRGASGKLYRYYVSAPLQQGGTVSDASIRRLAGPSIEKVAAREADRLLGTAGSIKEVMSVAILEDHLELSFAPACEPRLKRHLSSTDELTAAEDRIVASMPMRLRLRGGQTFIEASARPETSPDPVLIKALRRAHEHVRLDRNGRPVLGRVPASPYLAKIIRLAFLAPEIQADILAGHQPRGLLLERLMKAPIPVDWAAQKTLIDQLSARG
ncbi:hypothetical protein B5C34_14510 [Pacificimonas flava]|uniref:Resolvase n=2 Tax=Pacificimonas TaxID=1960290 RepID=A0A219B0Z0_9SPHN|nr:MULTISPECIES: recombinase family protein [Pacificimonas]MBZ6380100.1 recombinase family protein [Pacificimonas aurantium]OWV31980.1 hypothetical protein B5C34_14510 [Pacificimonas flava]